MHIFLIKKINEYIA